MMNATRASAGTMDSKQEASLDGSPTDGASSQETRVEVVRRQERSLGLLASKFIELLLSAEDGVLNLKTAADTLNIQRRRIYDIISVLKGFGLIEKRGRNIIQLRRPGPGSCFLLANKVSSLEKEIKELDAKERNLDQEIKLVLQGLQTFGENPINAQDVYVMPEDVDSSYKDRILLVIRASKKTTLQCYVPKGTAERSSQIYLKSNLGPIDVLSLTTKAVPISPPKKKTVETEAVPISLPKEKTADTEAVPISPPEKNAADTEAVFISPPEEKTASSLQFSFLSAGAYGSLPTADSAPSAKRIS